MSSLTDEEKARGRIFRGVAQSELCWINSQSPPTFKPLPVSGHYRHNCAARKGISTALQLHEVYMVSSTPIGEQGAVSLHTACVLLKKELSEECLDGWPGDEGRFAYVFREGTCKGCGQTARSPIGVLVDAVERPPLPSAVVR